jgi:hypothetical protein
MKNLTFKWITKLNELELRELRKYSKVLSPKLHKFIGNLVSRYYKWNRKEDAESKDDFIDESHDYSEKYFANFAKSMMKIKQFMIDFLVVNEANKDKLLTEKILFKSAQRKNYSVGYFYHLHEWEKASMNQLNRSFDYEMDMYRVNYYRFFHPEFQKSKQLSHHNNTEYIPEEVLASSWNHLQVFSLIAQTRLACEIEYQKLKVANKGAYLTVIEDDLNISLVAKYANKNIVLNVYFHIYKWLKNNNFEDVTTLKAIVPITVENIHLFSTEEQVSVLVLLNNCLGRLLRHSKDFETPIKLLSDIAIVGFEQNIFGRQLDLDLNFFLGLIDVIIHTGDKPTEFLKNNTKKLIREKDKDWANIYIKVRKLMQEKKFSEAIVELDTLYYSGEYALVTRRFVLLLQCTYELKQTINSTAPVSDIGLTELTTWLKNIKTIRRTFNESAYTQKASKTNEHIALFNFVRIISVIYLQTHSMYEIEEMIKNEVTYGIPWLKAKLMNYVQCPKSALDNKLKTYEKVRSLLS